MRVTDCEMRRSRVRSGLVVGALAAWVGVAACGGGGGAVSPAAVAPPPLAPLPPGDRIYQDNAGAIQDSLREVLRDRAAFEEAWARATRLQPSPPTPPAIDFDEKMAVLVAAGRMTPEDQIQVDSVGIRRVVDASGEEQDVLAVIVRTTVGCGRFAVDAWPMQIALVPQFDGEVRFVERREQAAGCGPPAPDAR